ncbi:MAG TPA: phosphotransferase family protein [Thermoanaerobaculia bacterium]|nr:phosphotransferase family protein [Thermoanaerobaculia bacterium]
MEDLSAYLQEHLAGFAGGLEVLQFPAGYSNLTYLLRLSTGDGPREVVLRRPPFGSRVKTAHDMGREFRVLSGLARVWPKAPRPLLHCDDPAVLGAPFYLMERVPGVILRSRPAAGVELTPEVLAGLSRAFVAALAELHAVDPAAAGLADLGRPEGYVERQVRGWAERYRAARTDHVPEVERAADWLLENLPGPSPDGPAAALIHNDFKYDNLVLDPADLTRIVAVLDWEMATVGDPLMDLGSSLAYWIDPGDPEELLSPAVPHLTAVPCNLRRSELFERYLEASGRHLPPGAGPVFYYAYGQLKLAGIVQQIYYRYRQGATADPRFAGLGALVRACGRAACLAIDRGRIDRLTD